MKDTIRTTIRNKAPVILATLVLCQTSTVATAQYAWFARNTDSIAVDGQTVLSSQATYEAVFMLPSSLHSGGSVFGEQTSGQEHKSLSVSIFHVGGSAWPNSSISVTDPELVSLDSWHHVAVVFNGSELRLYVDGRRLQSQAATSLIGNGPRPGAIGAFIVNAGTSSPQFKPSFVGYLDSIRISKTARYSGLSFTPPMGDMTSDTNTVLLYNFNDPTDSTTVADGSPLSLTGTLGVGFAGATSPRIISALPTQVSLNLKIFTAIELEFSSSVNGKYYLQSSPDLAVWSDLPGVIIGDGNVMTNLSSIRGNPKLLYRIVSRP